MSTLGTHLHCIINSPSIVIIIVNRGTYNYIAAGVNLQKVNLQFTLDTYLQMYTLDLCKFTLDIDKFTHL